MMEAKIINDPIWGPIELHPLCIRIIDTPQFQRLRYIKQLGGISFVYPGACHCRFEHSIGTSYLARSLGLELQKNLAMLDEPNKPDITDKEILCLEVAGLCHDLGHGPFSHLFDQLFIPKFKKPGDQTWEHEDATLHMLDSIFKIITWNDYLEDEDIKFIKDLIKKPDDKEQKKPSPNEKPDEKEQKKPFLYEIIANGLNKIDVDKWDYFSRDCHMLGLHHNFQCKRSIKLARVVNHGEEWHISYPKSEYYNLFDMFYTRYTLHRQAYHHPVAKAVELMITDAFVKANKSLLFPPNQQRYNQKTLSESKDDMRAYLWVTDDVLNQIRFLNSDNNVELEEAQQIINRIFQRDLYKLVGEKRMKCIAGTVSPGDLKEGMEQILKSCGIRRDLFEIMVVTFNYGNGNENPLINAKWYHKVKGVKESENGEKDGNKSTLYQNIESSVIYESDAYISDMLPKTFEQKYLRLFWKGTKSEELYYEKIKLEFSKIKTFQDQKRNTVEFVDTILDRLPLSSNTEV
nr:deoxynucleoside triphosphate triphosphohydrolase SAMHD1 isoform X1 [Crassostrea gigas]